MGLTRAEFEALYAAGADALFALFARQEAQMAALTARVAELEGRLAGNSQNSHRPPSSDGPRKPPRGQRRPSGKRPGGQPGHPGHTLRMVATPDRVVEHRPGRCAACGAALAGVPACAVVRRQVVDLPPLALAVTEHRAARVRCPACHRPTTAAFPAEVAQPVQYGPRLKGVAVYLRHYQLLPYARAGEVLADLCGARLSLGTLEAAEASCAAALAEVEEGIKAALRGAAVAHADETGVAVAGRRHWVHVVSTARLTHYAQHAKRGQVATDAVGILPAFAGRLVHDAWAPYWRYACAHALCNAHHLRELTAVAEQVGQPWATALHTLLRAMQRAVARARARGSASLAGPTRERFVARYRRALAEGYAMNPPPARDATAGRRGRLKQSAARNLLDRLAGHEAEALAFLDDWRVPFDNNQAERDLRMLKVQQKISGTFRAPAGADRFCRIRGYISTLRKQGLPVLTALEQALRGQPLWPDLAPE